MFVYFIATEADQPTVKIGKANNVKARLKELQTGSPFKLSVLGRVKCGSAKKSLQIESKAHSDLAAHRLHGEWFALVPEVEAYLAGLKRTVRPDRREKKPEVQDMTAVMAAVEEGLASGELMKVTDAAAKYGIDPKRLRGRIWRGDLFDPIGYLPADVVYDGWRLRKLATISPGSERVA